MTTRRKPGVSDRASKVIAAILILGIAFFTANMNAHRDRSIKKAAEDNLELKLKVASYEAIQDSLQEAISAYADTVNDLRVSKTKIVIRYEKKLKDYSNSSIVSDDSITLYISDKINSRR